MIKAAPTFNAPRPVAYDALRKPAEAVKDWDRAIELSPPAEQWGLRASRATSRLQAGMVAKAVAEVAELTKMKTKTPVANAPGSPNAPGSSNAGGSPTTKTPVANAPGSSNAAGSPNAGGSPKWNADQWYGFACIYAVASKSSRINPPARQEYADRAMELLHQAVQAGYKDADHMKKDADLDPLRAREDFKKLLTELEANAEKK